MSNKIKDLNKRITYLVEKQEATRKLNSDDLGRYHLYLNRLHFCRLEFILGSIALLFILGVASIINWLNGVIWPFVVFIFLGYIFGLLMILFSFRDQKNTLIRIKFILESRGKDG